MSSRSPSPGNKRNSRYGKGGERGGGDRGGGGGGRRGRSRSGEDPACGGGEEEGGLWLSCVFYNGVL